jgi:hypothetical protein
MIWAVMPCSSVKSTDVLEEGIASVFGVEENGFKFAASLFLASWLAYSLTLMLEAICSLKHYRASTQLHYTTVWLVILVTVSVPPPPPTHTHTHTHTHRVTGLILFLYIITMFFTVFGPVLCEFQESEYKMFMVDH